MSSMATKFWYIQRSPTVTDGLSLGKGGEGDFKARTGAAVTPLIHEGGRNDVSGGASQAEFAAAQTPSWSKSYRSERED